MKTFTLDRWEICGIVASILCMTATTSIADECPDLSSARPAQLVNSDQNLEIISELVSPWKLDEPVRLIKLGAYINKTGRIEGACCSSSTHKMSAGASRLLGRRLERLIFKPASHNGEALRVFAGFSVVAKKSSDGVVIDLLMNQLHSMDRFGTDYLAPQRIWTKSMWSEGRRAGGRVYFEVQATVSTSGHGSDGKVVNQNQEAAAIGGITTARLESACYIPGYYDGKPTEMIYLESFAKQ